MRSWLSKNRHVYWLLGLIALALAYFATLFALGFRLRDFRRRGTA